MEIQYLGHSCFRIKGKKTILVTDPFNSSDVGLKFSKVTADLVTITHQHSDHNYISGVTGTPQRKQPFVISGPGEYEISGVFVLGISSFHDNNNGAQRGKNTIYIISIDGLRLVHLGDLGHKLDDKQLEEINGVDILFIPVGGVYTIDSKQASEVIAQIAPKIVIPMHFKRPELALDLAPVEEFLQQMGQENLSPLPRLVISKEKLPEETTVILLAGK